MGRVLRQLGFSHISARPKHPKQKDGAIEAFKKNSRTRLQKS
jgi:transposase